MPPILNPHRKCGWEEKKVGNDPARLLSTISEFMHEPVKLVIIATVMESQPHPDEGIHRVLAITGNGTTDEAFALILQLGDMVEEQVKKRTSFKSAAQLLPL